MGCGINLVDVAGAEMLSREAQRRHGQRGSLSLCEIKPDVQRVLERSGYLEAIGADHLFATQKEALDQMMSRIDSGECRQCNDLAYAGCPMQRRR